MRKKIWSVLLPYRNLFILAAEMFKVVKDISPKIIKEVFSFYFWSNINLSKAPTFYRSCDASILFIMAKCYFLFLSWVGSLGSKKLKLTYWISVKDKEFEIHWSPLQALSNILLSIVDIFWFCSFHWKGLEFCLNVEFLYYRKKSAQGIQSNIIPDTGINCNILE